MYNYCSLIENILVDDLIYELLLIKKCGFLDDDFDFDIQEYSDDLSNVIKLMDCLQSIIYFHDLFEFYHIEPDKNNTQIENKSAKIEAILTQYGFFDLQLVKQLKEDKREELVKILSSNQLPYCIAFFDYLGFFKHLDDEKYFKSNRARDIEISKWFDSDNDGRTIRGNKSTLTKPPKEDSKPRYTAYQHKNKVKEDYLRLK